MKNNKLLSNVKKLLGKKYCSVSLTRGKKKVYFYIHIVLDFYFPSPNQTKNYYVPSATIIHVFSDVKYEVGIK